MKERIACGERNPAYHKRREPYSPDAGGKEGPWGKKGLQSKGPNKKRNCSVWIRTRKRDQNAVRSKKKKRRMH